jgi:hypothetical protein
MIPQVGETSGDAGFGEAAVSRDQFAELVREQRLVETHPGDPVVCPADAPAEGKLAQLDRDFLANCVVAALEIADATPLARQFYQQASGGLAVGPAKPDWLADCVAPVSADRKNGHGPPTFSTFSGVIIRPYLR